ncbi:uncharacterized protein LTR77_003238 [Saxophila tyrrhenica]|uniref:Uncharacterized protein n=1 Tax=Saxophila tyrrhenica TaxID=1690608 RepID=A0AAV9PHS4_9PEZI|nr:hypothetical protein LTR77_003238 [Saxophila tyrrhenica]
MSNEMRREMGAPAHRDSLVLADLSVSGPYPDPRNTSDWDARLTLSEQRDRVQEDMDWNRAILNENGAYFNASRTSIEQYLAIVAHAPQFHTPSTDTFVVIQEGAGFAKPDASVARRTSHTEVAPASAVQNEMFPLSAGLDASQSYTSAAAAPGSMPPPSNSFLCSSQNQRFTNMAEVLQNTPNSILSVLEGSIEQLRQEASALQEIELTTLKDQQAFVMTQIFKLKELLGRQHTLSATVERQVPMPPSYSAEKLADMAASLERVKLALRDKVRAVLHWLQGQPIDMEELFR